MARVITGKMTRVAEITNGGDNHIVADVDGGTLILVARNDYQADSVGLVFYDAVKLRSLRDFCQDVAAKCDELINEK